MAALVTIYSHSGGFVSPQRISGPLTIARTSRFRRTWWVCQVEQSLNVFYETKPHQRSVLTCTLSQKSRVPAPHRTYPTAYLPHGPTYGNVLQAVCEASHGVLLTTSLAVCSSWHKLTASSGRKSAGISGPLDEE
jgi:hypothetical protein